MLKSKKYANQTIYTEKENVKFNKEGIANAKEDTEKHLATSKYIEHIKETKEDDSNNSKKVTTTTTKKATTRRTTRKTTKKE